MEELFIIVVYDDEAGELIASPYGDMVFTSKEDALEEVSYDMDKIDSFGLSVEIQKVVLIRDSE